jgi:hypothetical protein
MGNFVETGMCYLHTASLIGQYLVNTKQLSPLIADEVVKLSPNIRREEPLQNVQNVVMILDLFLTHSYKQAH